MAHYAFLPWTRQGLIGALDATTDVVGGRAQLAIRPRVTIAAAPGPALPKTTLGLFGPGDVAALDPAQVVRTDPPAQATGVEPNYFASVEFARADLPWMFSPAPPNGARLRPWLCLVVVEQRDGVDLSPRAGTGLQVLTLDAAAAADLPDLAETWAWAHTQVLMTADTDADPGVLAATLATAPQRALSRLLCPRALVAQRRYVACVVPTTRGGMQAGLGDPVEAATVLDDAWTTADPLQLPVYYSWTFTTGEFGDFASLLAKLRRKKLTPAEAGTRKLDIGHAGYDLPASDPVDLEGALGPERDPQVPAAGPSNAYQTRLQSLLNGTAGGELPVLAPPLYGQWHAAQRAIPDPRPPGAPRDRAWLKALNLDPRYRVPAGLGAQIVRDLQEPLMASAWEQAGAIATANQMIRCGQLARAAGQAVFKTRLSGLDAASLLLMSAPAQSRIPYQASPGRTARGHVADTALPTGCTSAPWRRLLRARGGPARAWGVQGKAARSALIEAVNANNLHFKPAAWPTPQGMVSTSQIVGRSACGTDPQVLRQSVLTRWSAASLESAARALLLATTAFKALLPAAQTAAHALLQQAANQFQLAITAFQQYQASPPGDAAALNRYYIPGYLNLQAGLWALIAAFAVVVVGATDIRLVLLLAALKAAFAQRPDVKLLDFGLTVTGAGQHFEPCSDPPPVVKPPLALGDFTDGVLVRLNPSTALPARLRTRISAPGWDAEKMDTILLAPDFPAPMVKELVALSQEWLLPGLANVPADTLTLVESNPRFIEAFMVGLNHEMSRELLWRGYPTDQRGTCFRQFWDPAGGSAPRKDIPPIHEWLERALGTNFGQPGSGEGPASPASQVVLLVRGELMQRYPRANIFLARAQWNAAGTGRDPVVSEADPAQLLLPLFRGRLEPDLSLVGFALDAATAIGSANPADSDPGWFLALEQQPSEPRFGLDAEPPRDGPQDWRDLAWPNLVGQPGRACVQLARGYQNFPAAAQVPAAWQWSAAADAAQLAAISLRRPVRLYIHASGLL